MKLSFRWYGDSDPISLEYISQIPGMRSIVTACVRRKARQGVARGVPGPPEGPVRGARPGL